MWAEQIQRSHRKSKNGKWLQIDSELVKDFSKKFRDALFLVDEVDKKNVEIYLKKKKSSWKEMLFKDSRWIFRRVKSK